MAVHIAKAGKNLGSGLRSLFTQATTIFSHMKKSEIAEALIAAWCVEFLRTRKVRGLNVVEVIAISTLMMGARAVIMEARRRKNGESEHSVVMSNRFTSMDRMAKRQHTIKTSVQQ